MHIYKKISCLHFRRDPGPSLLKTIFHIQGEPILLIVSSPSTLTIEFPIKSGVVACTYTEIQNLGTVWVQNQLQVTIL